MPRFCAPSMLFTEVDFLERFDAARGFAGVEYLFPMTSRPRRSRPAWKPTAWNRCCSTPAGDWAKGERGIACHPDRVQEFREGVDKAIAYARVLGNRQVNCLAGIRPRTTAPASRRPSSTTCATPPTSWKPQASAWSWR